jgi:hypothetical protein
MWKKITPPLILILLLSVCSLLAQEKKVKKVFRIGVTQFTSTLASEKDEMGFEKALVDAIQKVMSFRSAESQEVARPDLAQVPARNVINPPSDLLAPGLL